MCGMKNILATSKIIFRAYEDIAAEAEIDAACGRLLNKIRIALM
jgi:hypothetical protein